MACGIRLNRYGCRLEDFVATLKGLSGKEVWMFDHDEEHVIRSLPDAVAQLLEKLAGNGQDMKSGRIVEARSSEPEATSQKSPPLRSHDTGMTCPQCGAPMEPVGGCAYCFSCGYSPCK